MSALLETAEILDTPGAETEETPPQIKTAKPKPILQGSAVLLPEIELWPEAVNGADVLSKIAETFARYAVLPDGAADALALWAAHAHGFKAFCVHPVSTSVRPQSVAARRRCATCFPFLFHARCSRKALRSRFCFGWWAANNANVALLDSMRSLEISTVGMRRFVSMKLIICRESRVNSASRFSDRPLDSRLCRMTFANATHTGSSAVRGNGLLCAVNVIDFQGLVESFSEASDCLDI